MRIMSSKIVLALVALTFLAITPPAFAGHGYRHSEYHRHGYAQPRYRDHHDQWQGYRYRRGGYRHGYHDHLRNWLAGAVVASVLTGIVVQATQPSYHDHAPPPPPPRVTYTPSQAPVVIYESSAPRDIGHRVEETRIDRNPDRTRFIRDDGWDGQGN